ncbi:hypothetical protein M426DRAFT_14958 [Hypoxylon sp. CI-4A]|nr:hypothetical protein M426DRAFT_14958 [Hypoxylon sp. CI-4A]
MFRSTHVKLDMFLLLDALDEYDGHPEFICDFLSDAMDMATSSGTRLKILFSSRPWETFKQRFENTPSIQLHDHTKGDIEQYCLGTIELQAGFASTVLRQIVPEVTNRANGVFLWVKLVLQELISEGLGGKALDGLKSSLDSIPSDLHNYYARTVQRIPDDLRWNAYVIFEATALSEETLVIFDILVALRCSLQSTYQGCKEILPMVGRHMKSRRSVFHSGQLFSTRGFKHPFKSIDNQMKGDIVSSTGNLIDITPIGKYLIVQFTHQTVKEFVHSPDFKQLVLGHRATQTKENGHTFLAKSFMTHVAFVRSTSYIRMYQAAYHCLMHEMTTGYSLKSFIDSFPERYFGNRYRLGKVHGQLSFAVWSGLQLYIEETLRSDIGAIKKTKEKLMPPSFYPKVTYERSSALLHLLFQNGYTIQQDPRAFQRVLDHPFNTHLNIDVQEARAALLIANGWDANTRVWKLNLSNPILGSRPLHLAKTLGLTRCLLEHGARVNELNMFGSTPLDSLFKLWVMWDDIEAWHTAELLVRHGGVFKTTKISTWEEALTDFEESGFDTTLLREYSSRIFS